MLVQVVPHCLEQCLLPRVQLGLLALVLRRSRIARKIAWRSTLLEATRKLNGYEDTTDEWNLTSTCGKTPWNQKLLFAALLVVALIRFAVHCVVVLHCFALRYLLLCYFALLCLALRCLG